MTDLIYYFSPEPETLRYYVSPYEYGSIQFEEGYSKLDFRLVRQGNDLVILQKNTDVQIFILDQFSDLVVNSDVTQPINSGVFSDGTEISLFENIIFEGTSGEDVINGTDNNDIINAKAGADTLQGSGGDDTYIWNIGDGDDVINDTDGYDKILLGEGITRADVKLSNIVPTSEAPGPYDQYSGDSLHIKIGDESIVVTKQFDDNANDFVYDGGVFEPSAYAVEILEFADGTTLDLVNNIEINGTEGADYIEDRYDDNTITGHQGDDVIVGEFGDDTYIWNIGDGNDTISDFHGKDRILFGAGISKQDVFLNQSAKVGDTFGQTISIGDETITIEQNFSDQSVIEYLEFANGDKINLTKNVAYNVNADNDAVSSSEFNAVFYGDDRNNQLIGNIGNDRFYSGSDADSDVIDGGAGSDIAYYNGRFDEYTVAQGIEDAPLSPIDYTISKNPEDGALPSGEFDSIVNVEKVYFADGIFDTATGTFQTFEALAPVANHDNFYLKQGKTMTGLLWKDNGNGRDIAAEGETLKYVSKSFYTDSGAKVAIDKFGWFKYTPNASYSNGIDTFNYTIVSATGERDTGTVTVHIAEDILLSPRNSKPIAQNDEFTIEYGENLTGILWKDNGNGKDYDPDGSQRIYTAGRFTTAEGNKFIQDKHGWFKFEAAEGFSGKDTITYTLSDGNLSDTATVTINVGEDPLLRVGSMPLNSVYLGNGDGNRSSINGILENYEEWLGQDVWGLSVHAGNINWGDWLGSLKWIGNVHADIIEADYNILWSIHMFPLSGANMQDAAAGEYHDYYVQAAQELLRIEGAESNDPIHIRTGWEFNFHWASPTAYAIGQEQDYVDTFRNFVTSFRSVSDRFVFEWSPNIGTEGSMRIEDAYPGNEYVDVIGMDVYWNINYSNIQDPVEAWNHMLTQPYGLNWLTAFAEQQGKPIGISEWGVNADNSAPYLEAFRQWFEDNNVIYQNYWESNQALQGKMSYNDYPTASKIFLEAFGVPGEQQTETQAPVDNLPETPDQPPISGAIQRWTLGTSATEELYGDNANNAMAGLGGRDTLYGGLGDDHYRGIYGSETIIEYEDEGIDSVLTYAKEYTLSDNVENLYLVGTYKQSGTGNELDNYLSGNDANNVFRGMAGNDWITTKGGNDVVIFREGDGHDVIADFSIADDRVYLEGYRLVETNPLLTLYQSDDDTIVYLDEDNSITILNTQVSDFVFNNFYVGSYGKDIVEVPPNYINGGDEDDILVGTDNVDIINGGEGADILYGAGGPDIFVFTKQETPATDEVMDFSIYEKDILDISDYLTGYDPIDNALSEFLLVETSTENVADKIVRVDIDGVENNHAFEDILILRDSGVSSLFDLLTTNSIVID